MQTNKNNTQAALMMAAHTLLGITRPWLIAACLLITAVLLLPSIVQLNTNYQALLTYLPYGLGLMVILLGQQFVQGRIAMAATNLLIGYGIIQTQLQAPLEQDIIGTYFAALSIFWPLNFFIIYWLPERKLFSSLGGLLLAIISIQITGTYVLAHYVLDYSQPVNHYLALQPFNDHLGHYMQDWIIPLANSAALLTACLILFIHTLVKHDRTHCVLLACMITTILICGWFDQAGISSLFSSLIASALLVTLLFNSHDLAFLDELTGLPGRRALINELKHCGRHYCIVMADIDHFKNFNDTHGHDTGDDVLRIVALELAKVRGGGRAFRYGGEEFTLLFKRKSSEEAEPYIERVRQNIANYPLKIRNQQTRPKRKNSKNKNVTPTPQVQVTVSFGMANRVMEQKPTEVMKCADKALYQAKENGRNCIAL